MLTDTSVKALKPHNKLYKVKDRDGMYVAVQPSGAIVFRYDYRLNGRRETVTLGRYGPQDLSLARAREKLIDAKRMVLEGRSPAQEKQHEKRRLKEAKRFGEFAEKWFTESRMADWRPPGTTSLSRQRRRGRRWFVRHRGCGWPTPRCRRRSFFEHFSSTPWRNT